MTDDRPPPSPHQVKLAGKSMRRNLSAMLTHYPFFGALALRMPMKPTDGVRDIACDGEVIYFNARWVLDARAAEIVEGISRVCLATALKHHTRRGNRNRRAWQVASNKVTTPILRDSDLTDDKGGLRCTAEQAYEVPPDEPGSDGGDSAAGAGDGGDGAAGGGGGAADPWSDKVGEVMDHPRLADDDDAGTDKDSIRREIEAQIDKQMTQANQTANAMRGGNKAGKSSDSVDELIRALGRAKTPFEEFLRQFVVQNGSRDYSWSWPNRRHIDSGLYLPSIRSESMPPVIFIIDTSASLESEKLAVVWRELRGTCEDLEPEAVVVIQHDVKVHRVDTYDCHELPFELNAVGRGGTSFIDCYRAVEGLPTAACIIHFTDMECDEFPKQKPSAPVLWARIDGGGTPPPFGVVMDVVE